MLFFLLLYEVQFCTKFRYLVSVKPQIHRTEHRKHDKECGLLTNLWKKTVILIIVSMMWQRKHFLTHKIFILAYYYSQLILINSLPESNNILKQMQLLTYIIQWLCFYNGIKKLQGPIFARKPFNFFFSERILTNWKLDNFVKLKSTFSGQIGPSILKK